MTGEVSHPSKTITGRCFNVCLGVSDRFPDYKFKLIRLTRSGHGALLSPHLPITEEILCSSKIISRRVTSDFLLYKNVCILCLQWLCLQLLHESYQSAGKPLHGRSVQLLQHLSTGKSFLLALWHSRQGRFDSEVEGPTPSLREILSKLTLSTV